MCRWFLSAWARVGSASACCVLCVCVCASRMYPPHATTLLVVVPAHIHAQSMALNLVSDMRVPEQRSLLVGSQVQRAWTTTQCTGRATRSGTLGLRSAFACPWQDPRALPCGGRYQVRSLRSVAPSCRPPRRLHRGSPFPLLVSADPVSWRGSPTLRNKHSRAMGVQAQGVGVVIYVAMRLCCQHVHSE